MKRIHLFEIEDMSWFPNWLRICLTRLINVMHGLWKTSDVIAELVAKVLKKTNTNQIVDLCSGSGGPMLDVIKALEEKHGLKNIQLTLTDLYPNTDMAKVINEGDNKAISYKTTPVDATKVKGELKGLRTMIGSFHHIAPENARKILQSTQDSGQPICIFEMSDNAAPIILGFIALPINFIMTLLITPFVRPLTLQQLVFTYMIPIIPICFAWDGAVSNMRTYTLNDMDELLEGLTDTDKYEWEKGAIDGAMKKLYLLGYPK